jgi:hypothetical protein
MCDSVNHSRFPKEDHLLDWVRRDKHGNEGDRVDTPCLFRKGYNTLDILCGENNVLTLKDGKYNCSSSLKTIITREYLPIWRCAV